MTNPTTCKNCNHPLDSGDKFCPNCGQKYTVGNPTVRQLLGEFFSHFLNLDNQIFRSIGALFIPGKLTSLYFQGKRKSYYSPIRIFFICAILFGSTLSYLFSKQNGIKDPFNISGNISVKKTMYQVDSLMDAHKATLADSAEIQALENFEQLYIQQILGARFHELNDTNRIELLTVKFADIPINVKDLDLAKDDFINKYFSNKKWWEQELLYQVMKMARSGKNFINFLIGKVSIALFFMIPVLAFFLKLIYIRRKRYYVEHLVFSYHTHAFYLVLVSVALLISLYFKQIDTNLVLMILGLAGLYFLVALKRTYNQGWIKTLIKMFIIGTFYTMLLAIFTVLFSFVGFLLF